MSPIRCAKKRRDTVRLSVRSFHLKSVSELNKEPLQSCSSKQHYMLIKLLKKYYNLVYLNSVG